METDVEGRPGRDDRRPDAGLSVGSWSHAPRQAADRDVALETVHHRWTCGGFPLSAKAPIEVACIARARLRHADRFSHSASRRAGRIMGSAYGLPSGSPKACIGGDGRRAFPPRISRRRHACETSARVNGGFDARQRRSAGRRQRPVDPPPSGDGSGPVPRPGNWRRTRLFPGSEFSANSPPGLATSRTRRGATGSTPSVPGRRPSRGSVGIADLPRGGRDHRPVPGRLESSSGTCPWESSPTLREAVGTADPSRKVGRGRDGVRVRRPATVGLCFVLV
jgi:hypothetical protein